MDDAIGAISRDLIPISRLFTPNADEASLLLGGEKVNQENMEVSAKKLYNQYGVPVLLKGGHLQKNGKLVDILFDGNDSHLFPSDYISNVSTHGTGCTYSAAITANLALGKDLKTAVIHSKMYLHNTILNSLSIGNSTTLNHFVSKDLL